MAPQRHAPAVQLSATVDDALQLVQAPPPVPHAPVWFPAAHVLPEQHPAQVAASQTHAPATQSCPAPHAALLPQRHAPPEQLSALFASHAEHVPPLAPHALVWLPARQLLPEQQPAQEVESHTQLPDWQRWPAAQAASLPQRQLPLTQLSATVDDALQLVHAPPLVPHVPAAAALQVLPEQQPLGHEVASHTHAPLTQR